MLNVKLSADTPIQLINVVNALAIGHVSKYAVDVMRSRNYASEVWFFDSRFSTGKDFTYDEGIAALSYSQGEFFLKSNRIKNDRYNSYSDGYHTRKTGDHKKMLRILKEVIKPFDEFELAKRSEGIDRSISYWRETPRDNLVELMHDIVGTQEMLEEIMYLKSLGVSFRSEKFQRVANQAGELEAEYRRRQKVFSNTINLYVYEQPDAVVTVVFFGDTKSVKYKKAHHWVYENMESVPEAIRQQVALLKLSEADTYVPEVGKRDTQNAYWVHVPEDQFTLPQPLTP